MQKWKESTGKSGSSFVLKAKGKCYFIGRVQLWEMLLKNKDE